MKKFLALSSIVIVAVLSGLSLLVLSKIRQNSSKPISEERKIVYVDSVWTKGPGEIHSMQTDIIYFARTTEGQVHQSRSRINVGDSFVYIYRKMP